MAQHPCPYHGCIRRFDCLGYLTRHLNSGIHAKGKLRETNPISAPQSNDPLSPSPSSTPDFEDPLLRDVQNPWEPFADEVAFRVGNLLFKKTEMSQGDIDELMDLWSLDIKQRFDSDSGGPFRNHEDLLSTIDSIRSGSAPWQCLQTVVQDDLPESAPEWQKTSYQVWYRDPDTVIANILANPDFADNFDSAPYVHLGKDGKRRWSDFMSGNFSFRHASSIYEDPETGGDRVAGAMYCPIILGADKTTVSVATGHVEYHPLYLSIGNLHGCARRGHRNGVIPIGFLAIPKSDRRYDNDPNFRTFKKQLYHNSIAAILRPLKPAMTTPVVRRCPDGHFRQVIYDLAAFIADYPEQVLLAGVVQGWCSHHRNLDGSGEPRTRKWDEALCEEYGGDSDVLWDNYGVDDDIVPFTHQFPRADIHEMLTPDLLHQIVKGCFKDMLVDWIGEYLHWAKEIMDEIDHRISVIPPFPGLRRFPQGRRFKQWTGNDSKALMKVYLPAVAEHIPEEMSQCLASFLHFCYLVRRTDFTEDTITEIQSEIHQFNHFRQIFISSGVREHFSIPRMHSMPHYPYLILEFGAPNGVCSSITESRHITAVKKPWRRSNRYNALSQMLLTNQRNDKLAALRSELAEHGLMPPLQAPPSDLFDTEKEDEGAMDGDHLLAKVELAKTRVRNHPRYMDPLAEFLGEPDLSKLTRRFLYEQLHGCSSDTVDLDSCPEITSKVDVFHSAVAMFYAPSDNSGIRGMHRERIRCTPSWYGNPRYDTVLVITDEDKPGFKGMSAARVRLFFSFQHQGEIYPCALVHWYNVYGRSRDIKTGMWVVRPSYLNTHQHHPHLAVIHVDALLRGAHLIPVYGLSPIPRSLKFYDSLDLFKAFYVNHYADYHANEILV
ncbi:hypothetical protein BT96DRAFT_1095902 [Gymnopus androsaceus JB14]|uniref:C2H2-type domain-containing protein n=1 Tax=Gymnopus androsaceus JB14 TaxID=1447944 RepID=A0A6A4HSF9_9AGAR|nr:hypothetical protein BT96DRAFT_1095902 [Gymnopus androsaceus JB14]